MMLPINQTFEHTLVKSRQWVDEVGKELAVDDPDRAVRALRAGLHAIRDWLPPSETVALGAQLPMLIRGLYYEGWRYGKHHGRDRDSIYAAVRHELAGDTLVANHVLDAVIRLLARHVSAGEIGHIIHVLPKPIADVWMQAMH
ncbi:MAG: hypothetical protein JWO36_2003 [Myxococcales bacterium]|nr:hypothetical protein [Myxococcales bacterium]